MEKGKCFHKKSMVVMFIILLLLSGLIFREKLIRVYVVADRERLEKYAESLLESVERQSTRYGFWKVKSYPEDQMVEFMTGGFGIAPSSTYKGFYYSRENKHKVFSVADESIAVMKIEGDYAEWTDGTDNHGSSVRITEKWFWFEASF